MASLFDLANNVANFFSGGESVHSFRKPGYENVGRVQASEPSPTPVGQNVSDWPGYTPSTPLPKDDWGAVFNGIATGAGDLFNSFFTPPPSSGPKMWREPTNEVIRQGVNGNTIPTPSATPFASPQASPMASSSPAGFRYVMGKNDYSDIRGQVYGVLAGTPLEGYAEAFIQAGERHGVDPRVLITIANNESSMGRRYPTDSYNPFGYIVNPPAYGSTTGLEKEGRIWQGLRNAGFNSMDHAIDRLTGRFQRQPTANYQTFYADPTIENLQAAYNANPEERDQYIKNAYSLSERFK